MRVRVSWKHALKLCTPINIKLFTLITLKSMFDVIRVLMVPWFLIPFSVCIIALCWLGSGVVMLLGGSGIFASTETIAVVCIQRILMVASSVIFILAARPSIGLKDAAYFKKNAARALWMFLYYSVCMVLLLFLLTPILYVLAKMGMAFLIFLGVSFSFLARSLYIFGNNFSILFYMDRTQGSWVALKRACLMLWYNLPAIAFYMFLAGVATLLVSVLVNFLLGAPFSLEMPFSFFLETLTARSYGFYSSMIILVNLLLEMIINLLYACLATNLYIKLVHDQYELYFPEDAHKE